MNTPKFEENEIVNILKYRKYSEGKIIEIIPAGVHFSKKFMERYVSKETNEKVRNIIKYPKYPKSFNRYVVETFDGNYLITAEDMLSSQQQSIKENGPEMVNEPVRRPYSSRPDWNKLRKPVFMETTNVPIFPGSSYIARKLSTIPEAFKNGIAMKHGFKTYQDAKDHKREPYQRFALKMLKQEIRYEWAKLISPERRIVGNYEDATKRNLVKSALLGLRYGGNIFGVSSDGLSREIHNILKAYIDGLPETPLKSKLQKAFTIANDITKTAEQIVKQFTPEKESFEQYSKRVIDNHGDVVLPGAFSKGVPVISNVIKYPLGSAPYDSLAGWEQEKTKAAKEVKNKLVIAWMFTQGTERHRLIAQRLKEIL